MRGRARMTSAGIPPVPIIAAGVWWVMMMHPWHSSVGSASHGDVDIICWRPPPGATPGGTVRSFSEPSSKPGDDAPGPPGPTTPRCLCRKPGAKFRALGVHFGYGISHAEEWDAIGKRMVAAMRAWVVVGGTTRLARSYCVKTVVWSMLNFQAMLRECPPGMMATLWAIAKAYVWRGCVQLGGPGDAG